MYSKAEAKKMREDFWVSFGKSFPKKWTLYDTKVKGVSFKFHFDRKQAMVSLDFEDNYLEIRDLYYQKLVSLKTILTQEYLPEVIFEENYLLENGKTISRVYVELKNVSINNKETWQQTMLFLYEKMEQFELFWADYQDVIKQ